MAEEIHNTLAKRSYDAIVASEYGITSYVRYFQKTPAILDDLELAQFLDQTPNGDGVRKGFSYARLALMKGKLKRHIRHVLPEFKTVTVVSERERRLVTDVAKNFHGKVAVIPNGIDCVKNQPKLSRAERNGLIYNGALSYSANYDAMAWFLSEILPLIQKYAPDVTIKITGSTRGVDLSGLTLSPAVQLTGYVPDIRIPVSQAAVCVVPLRQGGGTRLKILEAMALGTPVVTTSKGAEGLDIVHEVHALVADDPAAFAEQTVRLLKDDDLWERLSTNARQLVEEKYDWRVITPRFLHLVEEVARSQ